MASEEIRCGEEAPSLKAGVWVLRISLAAMPLAYLPGIYRSAPLPKLLVLQMAAFALALCCLTARRVRLPRGAPFVLPLLAVLLITSAQALRTVNPSRGLLMLATQVGYGLLCLGTASVSAPRETVSLFRFSAAAGGVVSLLGILEYLGVPWAMLPSAGRPSSTFGFRNIAGMYLAVNLPFAGALLFCRRRRDWMLGTLSGGAMAVFLVYTRTRGAWVGCAVALAALAALSLWSRRGGRPLAALLWHRLTPPRRTAVLVALCAVLAAGWLPPRFADRSLHRLDEKKASVGAAVSSLVSPGGDRGRLRVWGHTLEMIRAHPAAGVGLENWPVFFPLYDGGDALVLESAAQRPHNDFLWVWSELGTAGLLAYLWLLWAGGASAVRKIRRGRGQVRVYTLFLGMGALALLVHSLFSFPREQAAGSMLFWIALGLAARPESGGGDRIRTVGWGLRACAGAGAILALSGIWICGEAIRFDRHFARSLAAQAAGASEAQAEEARRALTRGTFDHRAFLLLGDAKSRLGDPAGAAAVYRTYLTYQPFLPAVHNNLGYACEASGAVEEAESAYLRGLEIYPGEETLIHNLAGLYRRRGELDRALDLYRSLEPERRSAETYHNLGRMHAEKRAFDRALEAYREALRLNPDLVEVHYSLGGLFLLMGDYAASARAFETFLAGWTGNPTYVRRAEKRLIEVYPVLGDAYIRQGDLGRAEAAYRRLEALGGATAEVYNNLATLYRRRGDRSAALAACRQAVAADPDFTQAYFTLAGLLEESKDREGALEAYRAFLDRWPKADRFAGHARQRIEALAGGR